ncbi:myosin-like protein [Plasmopara halstedii]|uniref:Myosin-like protein n=1 Tax=Plasmopara halstedii TaxID=4781 RepID=A0A0N7L8P7_PLAHL|nr:myosin-like protein [Plasmopara halstedii]CEG50467.1 myosin-like protein [Plasmopara halstedii]|eukprot:XP_024586836.1 myosin-like protein [Plasmopara halstedii]
MRQQREKDARKPRAQQLVFSTKKASRKAKERQQQGHHSVTGSAKAAPSDIQEEQEHESLSRGTQERRKNRSSRTYSQSVKHMRPSCALLQGDHTTVAQCVRMMVERKTDASLLVNKSGLLTGILTDRDVAVKVVAVGRDPCTTLAFEVMTPDPSCVSASSSAIDALKMMISGQFRHLPVTDNDKVVGILDIAKCLYEAITKLEHAYRISSDRLEETVKKLQRTLPGSTEANLFESLRRKLFLPTLSAIIVEGSEVPVLRPKSTAMDAACVMLNHKTNAVMVCDEAGRTAGIFTSKDLMRRVVALSLKPNESLLSSVMTPDPQTATLSTTILETLHSMHNGSFLHVPVFGDGEKLVGIVDVLQVTHGVIQQMGTFQSVRSDGVQPLWDQFRSSLKKSNDSGEHEEVEDDRSNVGVNDSDADGIDTPVLVGRQSWNEFQLSVGTRATGDSAALDENPLTEEGHVPDVFVYKLADSYGNNHRFTSSAESVSQLLVDVQTRLGDNTIRRVFYVDDEGDHVLLSEDSELRDAVNRARTWGNKYIRLMVPHYRLVRRVLAHNSETTIGMVVYAAAVAALAGASFFLSRRK